jgi:hypothetical protein
VLKVHHAHVVYTHYNLSFAVANALHVICPMGAPYQIVGHRDRESLSDA